MRVHTSYFPQIILVCFAVWRRSQYGVILWELCTRKKPFKGLNQIQVVMAVGFKGEKLPAVGAAVDPGLDKLLRHCTHRDMTCRPSMNGAYYARIPNPVRALPRHHGLA